MDAELLNRQTVRTLTCRRSARSAAVSSLAEEVVGIDMSALLSRPEFNRTI
jgi:hypothetical protein